MCIDLKEKRKLAKTEEEKQHFHKLFAEVLISSPLYLYVQHNEAQMQERILYQSRCVQAVKYPKEYCSIIIDGMNTSNIPLKMPMPKGNFFKKI